MDEYLHEFYFSFHFALILVRMLPLERKWFDTTESSCSCLKAINATHAILVENVKQWVYANYNYDTDNVD